MSKATARPRLISLPIFWQVLGLSLVVLVLALGINTLLVLKAPEPPPSGYSLQEVAAALKAGKITLHNGKTLKATQSDALPADFRPGSYSCKKWKLSQRLPPGQARQHCGEKSKKPPGVLPPDGRR